MAETSLKARATADYMVRAVKDFVRGALTANLSPVNTKIAELERRILVLETKLDERERSNEKAKAYAMR